VLGKQISERLANVDFSDLAQTPIWKEFCGKKKGPPTQWKNIKSGIRVYSDNSRPAIALGFDPPCWAKSGTI